jgi:hypothetical protein
MRADFIDEKNKVKFSSYFTKFSKNDYCVGAKNSNFNLTWKKLKILKNGINKLGMNFWEDYEKDCPYIGLVATKLF